MKIRSTAWLLIIVAAIIGLSSRESKNLSKSELIIFHAGSLSVPFQQISDLFKEQYPHVIIKAEASGSRHCARKISDLGRRCDVMASADYKVVENLLTPDYTDFNILFAYNEMVIAYTDKSIFSNKITSDNWCEILLKDEVTFGRSDPNLDPCGYRTPMVFQLAQKHYQIPDLAQMLAQKHSSRYIRPKETDLLALLEAGEIDYLFIYRSVAEQHKLKMILLPDKINLKSPDLTQLYNTAEIQISGKRPGEFITRKGEPMIYSVTIPKNAPNPTLARAWVQLLLSSQGREIMEKNGQSCLTPAKANGFDKLPQTLKQFCIK